MTSSFQTPNDTWGEFNNTAFVVQQMLLRIQTVSLVQVVNCTNDGGLSQVGFVDVVPLVNQINPEGNPTPHETIYNVPYFRIQGGSNAVIIDPQPGDIGMCGFCSRDISRVKSTREQGNPGSFRTFSFSDGLYFGGFLNGAPSQYVQFNPDGISIVSPATVRVAAPTVSVECDAATIEATDTVDITAPDITLTGSVVIDGSLSSGGDGGATASFSGDITSEGTITGDTDVVGGGTSLHTHIHGGVETGGGNTGGPVT